MNARWLAVCSFACLAINVIVCADHFCMACDAMSKWTVVVHKKGKEIVRKAVPNSTMLYDEIETASKKGSVSRSRIDFVTYAPSTRIESDLERIEFRGNWVVHSTRSTVDDSWTQHSRRTEESDRLLRQKIQLFPEDEK